MKNVFVAAGAAAAMASLLFLASSCNNTPGPAPQPDMVKYELKGNVASVRSIPYTVDSTEAGYEIAGVEASMNNVYVEFNESGMATRLERYNKEGGLLSTQETAYNPDGQISEVITKTADGIVVERTVYEYRRGRLAEMTTTDERDSLKKHEVYEYFGRDSVIAVFSYKEGKEAGHRVMKYDAVGNNTENVTYSIKDKVLSSFKLEYDEAGRNTAIESENIFFGNLDTRFTYDENGLRTSLLMKGERAETLFTFKLTLDSAGNWIERVTYKDDSLIPLRVDKREIKYR